MRVVLDTNILISAYWTQGGLEDQLVKSVLAGTLTACVSAAVIAEYRDVLYRPKFAAMRERAEPMLDEIERCAFLVELQTTVSAASDDDDNRFLECAEAAGAAYLVTGNLKHYPAQWGVTKIVNARQFFTSSLR